MRIDDAKAADPTFETLMAEVMTAAQRFGHRQHVQLTWLAVRTCGTPRAISLVSEGIQRTARYAGAPQKYHATVSRAWVELVGHHVDAHPGIDFDAFVDLNPALLDKRLLTRFYRPATLAASSARAGWVEPDLAPFPWQRIASRDPRADQWRWRPSSRNRFCRPGMQSAARFRRRLGRRRH
jgi:hypothetical protein